MVLEIRVEPEIKVDIVEFLVSVFHTVGVESRDLFWIYSKRPRRTCSSFLVVLTLILVTVLEI